ncbi:MAG: hypothetical protein QM607_12860 [Microbacterium sp.]
MKRRSIVLLGAAVLVVAGGVATVAVMTNTREPSPRDAAGAFVDALAAGDSDGVRALLDDPDEIDQATWDAFDAATTYPSQAEVTEVDAQETTADVTASALFDVDRPLEFTFTLTKDGDSWAVDAPPLTEAALSSTLGDFVSIHDVTLPSGTIELLPAIYDVTAWPSEYTEGSATVVAVGDSTTAEVEATLSAAVEQDAKAALVDHLADCSSTSDTVATSCGIVLPWPADLASLDQVAYRVDTDPEITVDLDQALFQATGGALTATATGTLPNGQPGEFTYRIDNWSIYGSIALDADGVALKVF